MVIGVPLGMLAGYRGGVVDAVLSRIAEVVMSLPVIVILLAVVAVYGRAFTITMGALGVILSASFIRLARATTEGKRNELYVDAARVSGLGHLRIAVRHILPNITAPLLIQSTLALSSALLIQAAWASSASAPNRPPRAGVGHRRRRQVRQPRRLADGADRRRPHLHRAGVQQPRGRPAGRDRSRGALGGAAPPDHLLRRDPRFRTPPRSGRPACRIPGRRVIDDVTLHVDAGEVLALVGESGSGKTQTAFSVLGLLAPGGRITGGGIHLDGSDLLALPDRKLAALRGTRMAYIPQEPMSNLDPCFTVGSQMVEPLVANLRIGRAEARKRALALLARVGIGEPERVYRSYPHEISGGWRSASS